MAKGDWQYMASETLKQTIAFDKKSGWLFCQDGTRYSPQELAKITKNWTRAIDFPLQVHLLKKEFGGEIEFVGEKALVSETGQIRK